MNAVFVVEFCMAVAVRRMIVIVPMIMTRVPVRCGVGMGTAHEDDAIQGRPMLGSAAPVTQSLMAAIRIVYVRQTQVNQVGDRQQTATGTDQPRMRER